MQLSVVRRRRYKDVEMVWEVKCGKEKNFGEVEMTWSVEDFFWDEPQRVRRRPKNVEVLRDVVMRMFFRCCEGLIVWMCGEFKCWEGLFGMKSGSFKYWDGLFEKESGSFKCCEALSEMKSRSIKYWDRLLEMKSEFLWWK